ncbi:hypothetical protein E4U54_006728, partial [Claviceps lovelessii]
ELEPYIQPPQSEAPSRPSDVSDVELRSPRPKGRIRAAMMHQPGSGSLDASCASNRRSLADDAVEGNANGLATGFSSRSIVELLHPQGRAVDAGRWTLDAGHWTRSASGVGVGVPQSIHLVMFNSRHELICSLTVRAVEHGAVALLARLRTCMMHVWVHGFNVAVFGGRAGLRRALAGPWQGLGRALAGPEQNFSPVQSSSVQSCPADFRHFLSTPRSAVCAILARNDPRRELGIRNQLAAPTRQQPPVLSPG